MTKPKKFNGPLLLQLRTERSLTQKQLADIAGTDQETISRLETGKTQPLLSTILSLSKAFDVTVESLMV
jgi:transcriptional regulator with XRE-family HTH domain